MIRPTVGLIDHGSGNLLSVRWALEGAGATVRVCRRPRDLASCAALVVPGVGASGPAMARLRRAGLDRAIGSAVDDGVWLMGICLGLQLLFEHSQEDGTELLGLLAGDVRPIPRAPRLPHIGWNRVETVRPHPLIGALGDGEAAYFVHGYAAVPRDDRVVVAVTEHGSRFPSVIAHHRLLGTQFHPERSGKAGRRLLGAYLALITGESVTDAKGVHPELVARCSFGA
jgi:imidazole glycerol-phosphate synthase subunit HisH